MKLVRFTARGIYDGRLIEPGEEIMVADDTGLGAHMIDLSPGAVQPSPVPRLVPVFRPELAHAPNQPPPVSPDEARAKATEDAMKRAEETRAAEAKVAAEKAAADKAEADRRAAAEKAEAERHVVQAPKPPDPTPHISG